MAAALALVSCSQEDLMTGSENAPSRAIGVNAFVPTVGRGTALNSEGDLVKAENGFDLYAFLNDGNGTRFMGDDYGDGVAFQGLGSNGSYTWNYVDEAEMRFWSEANGNPIKFFAVSPMNEKTEKLSLSKSISYASQTLDYTAPTTCGDQVDLMYAVTGEYASDDESASYVMNGIDLQFHHALSQIVFEAKTESALLYADVSKVEIKNIYGSGTFDMANGEIYRTADDKSAVSFPWTYGEANATSVYSAQLGATTPTDINTKYDENGNETATTNSNGNYQDGRLTSSSESLLLIPQNLKSTGAVLAITCNVRFNGDNGLVTIVDNKTFEVPITTDWQPGYKYTYTIIFSADMGGLIKVKSTGVDVWNEGGNTDVEYSPNRIFSYKSTQELQFEGSPFGVNNPIVSHTFANGVGTVVCQKDIQYVSICRDLSIENSSNESVTEIVLPESTVSIGTLAFISMKNLKTINMPNGVQSIADYAFAYCESLETITLPANLTIFSATFDGCKSLKEINLPAAISVVNLNTFNGCESLENIYIENNEKVLTFDYKKPKMSDYFDKVPSTLKVHVPATLVDDYKAAELWKEFEIVAR